MIFEDRLNNFWVIKSKSIVGKRLAKTSAFFF